MLNLLSRTAAALRLTRPPAPSSMPREYMAITWTSENPDDITVLTSIAEASVKPRLQAIVAAIADRELVEA